MIVSNLSNDPHFTLDPYEIYVNDKKVENCFKANEGLGVAHCYIMDKNGRVALTSRNTLRTKALYGKVRIAR